MFPPPQGDASTTVSDMGREPSAERVSSLEAALETWERCQPVGYTLPEHLVPMVLPTIQSRVASSHSANAQVALRELFAAPEDGTAPLFQRMLKARGGQVHFLHFWRAFSKAKDLVASSASDVPADVEGESVALELETLCDALLRRLDGDAAPRPEADGTVSTNSILEKSLERTLPFSAFAREVRDAVAMSGSPEFWLPAEAKLAEQEVDESSELSLDEVTVMMLSLLREAILWQHDRPSLSRACSSAAGSRSLSSARRSGEQEGLPVLLHIYDVSQEDSVRRLNRVLAHRNSPLKFGGVFHAGVEVNGLEWSFGMSLCESTPGISCNKPREHPQHNYRQTIQLKNTKFTAEEVADLISQLIEEYPGDDYDLLRRNCCHFADDFSRRLGAGRIPGWIYRLARVGARVDSALQAVANRRLLPGLADDDDDSPY